MQKSEAKKRIEKLREEINHHRYLYHVLDTQEISDAALDSLKKELDDLEQQFPDLISPDSPTQRVGGKPLDKFSKVPHKIPMYSMFDAFSRGDMENWQQRISKLVKDKFTYFCELKIDGFAVSLEYEKGLFVRGSTRGDGTVGEDVTQNLKTIDAIPLRLRQNLTCEIRGEVFLSKKEFDRINKQREIAGEQLYANPRNLAAGSIRQLDPKLAASRKLDFAAYDVVDGAAAKSHHHELHDLARQLGFKVHRQEKECKNLDEVFTFF
ncbi:MAG: hypothetical protein COT81_03810, partial [Candidatus Buchananbacteria bacterium CG10_big_fil_rev_8_21_14_0_10_42_9]